MSKNKNYMPISITMGAILGAGYGFRNPSEKVCKKLATEKPTLVETMKGYADCFDIKAAGQAVRNGNMNLLEYSRANNIYSAIYDVYEKEKQVIDIMNTPIEERTMTFKQAIREANKARPQMYKEMFKFDKEFKQKLSDLKVFDAEKFTQTYKNAAKKVILTYKELSKGALKGLAAGVAIGTIAGFFINSISSKN